MLKSRNVLIFQPTYFPICLFSGGIGNFFSIAAFQLQLQNGANQELPRAVKLPIWLDQNVHLIGRRMEATVPLVFVLKNIVGIYFQGYTKMKVRHALQKQLDALTERATHPEFNDDLAGITNAAVAVADELNKPDDFAF